MIKINLAPHEEVESGYWWLLDAIAFVLVLFGSMYGADYMLISTQEEIAQLRDETNRIQENSRDLDSKVAQYNELLGKIEKDNSIRKSLVKITQSKLTRYMPIILLEHIQNLKPEGVWLTSVSFQSAGISGTDNDSGGIDEGVAQGADGNEYGKNTIVIQGQAFDNIILAEFMTNLKATQMQEVDKTDLRTQLFFNLIDLNFSRLETVNVGEEDTTSMPSVIGFELAVTYLERDINKQPIDMSLSKLLDRYDREGITFLR